VAAPGTRSLFLALSRLSNSESAKLETVEGAQVMINPDSRHGRDLKAAEEFFALAKTTHVPFMRSYYQRVAERYLSSKGEIELGEMLGLSSRRASHPEIIPRHSDDAQTLAHRLP
jgi:hypothetical protein